MKARSRATGKPDQQKIISEQCKNMIKVGEGIKKLRDNSQKTGSSVIVVNNEEDIRRILESLGALSLSSSIVDARGERDQIAGG